MKYSVLVFIALSGCSLNNDAINYFSQEELKNIANICHSNNGFISESYSRNGKVFVIECTAGNKPKQ